MATAHAAAEAKKEEHQDPKEIKAAVNKVSSPSGKDKDGKPDGSLSAQQVERAATETLYALRPQPTRDQIEGVLAKLAEVDDEGQPKQKFKDVDGVIAAAQSALKEVSKAA